MIAEAYPPDDLAQAEVAGEYDPTQLIPFLYRAIEGCIPHARGRVGRVVRAIMVKIMQICMMIFVTVFCLMAIMSGVFIFFKILWLLWFLTSGVIEFLNTIWMAMSLAAAP